MKAYLESLERRIETLEAKFNANETRKNETIPHDDVIKLGGHEWTKVGKIDGHDLYLCNDIIKKMAFSKSNSSDWYKSDIREWLNTTFYNRLSSAKKANIVKHPETNDNIFLLSVEEVTDNIPINIRKIGVSWWMRTPGFFSDCVTYIFPGGTGYSRDEYANSKDIGVRPALLLK